LPYSVFGDAHGFLTDLVSKGCIPESIKEDIPFGGCFEFLAELDN